MSDEEQRQALELVADEWTRSRPNDDDAEVQSILDDCSRPIEDVIAEHFSPEKINDRPSFERNRSLLEQLSIMCALETSTEKEDRGRTDHDLIFGVWAKAMVRHRLALCDYPSLGLAFLAGAVRFSTPEEFVSHLGLGQ